MAKNVFELDAPKAKWIVGHTLDFGKDPLKFLEHCGCNYGEIIPLRFGKFSVCLLKNPQHISEVLQQKDIFVKSRGVQSLKIFLGQGLLTSEGESWFYQRKLIQPIFSYKRVLSYGRIMVEYTENMLQTWNDSEVRDINRDLMTLTLNIVMKSILNLDITNQKTLDLARTFDLTLDWFKNRRKQNFLTTEWFFLPENIRYKNAIAKTDKIIYGIIQARQESGEYSDDLLSLLLQVSDESGNRMNSKQIRDEIVTFVFAGHETTANALFWTIILTAMHPEIDQKLSQELNTVLGNNLPTVEDIPRLTYTENIIKESMRLYPPVPIMARIATQDYDLGEYRISAGYTLLLSQWLTQRSSEYFDRPKQFIPERWENNLEKQLPPGVYFPFSDGQRICIGKGFAMTEAVLLLATIAKRFKFSLLNDHPIAIKPTLTLRPEDGVKVQVTKR